MVIASECDLEILSNVLKSETETQEHFSPKLTYF